LAAALLAALGAASVAAVGCGPGQAAPAVTCTQACLAQGQPPNQPFPDPDPGTEPGPVRPMKSSQDPTIMELQCSSSPCGGVVWNVKFVLPAPAATSGWIVQEITRTYVAAGGGAGGAGGAMGVGGATGAGGAMGTGGAGGAAAGPGGAAGGCVPTGTRSFHFWEAFYVLAGATSAVYAPFDDSYAEVSHQSNTADTVVATGKAKFYEGTLPDDFTRCNMDTLAGTRRATVNQPTTFWDGTGTEHDLTVHWDCTPNHATWNVTTVPVTDTCTTYDHP